MSVVHRVCDEPSRCPFHCVSPFPYHLCECGGVVQQRCLWNSPVAGGHATFPHSHTVLLSHCQLPNTYCTKHSAPGRIHCQLTGRSTLVRHRVGLVASAPAHNVCDGNVLRVVCFCGLLSFSIIPYGLGRDGRGKVGTWWGRQQQSGFSSMWGARLLL